MRPSYNIVQLVLRLDFFIVGAQKAGTTALSAYLRRSPQVQIPALKEIHFFEDEARDWDNPDYDALTRHFSWEPDAPPVRGEATPAYLYWPNALERLGRHNPEAKLIVCLRHPAYRAHSHWRMETKRGDEALPFELAVSDIGRQRLQETGNGAHLHYSYIERGFYGRQIARLLEIFPRERLLFVETDDIWSEPDLVMRRVHDFLGLAPPDPVEKKYIVPVETRDVGPMSEAARDALTELYREDILQAAQLTGLTLERWLSPDYVEKTPKPFDAALGAFAADLDPLAEERAFEALDKTLAAAAQRAEKHEEWVKAAFFASDLRKYFPDLATGYRVGAASARNLGRWDEAARILEAGRERFSEAPWVKAEAVWAVRQRGDLEEALRLSAGLRKAYPRLPDGCHIGALSARELGRWDEAQAILTEAAALVPDERWVAVETTLVARSRGEIDLASSLAADLRRRFPGNRDGYQLGAAIARERGAFGESDAILAAAAAIFPDEAWLLSESAWTARCTGDLIRASDLALRLRDRYPDYSAGYQLGAGIARELGRPEEAAAILAEGLSRCPEDVWIRVELAWTARAQGDFDEAIGLAAQIRDRFPDMPAGYHCGVVCLRSQNRLAEALSVLREAISQFPADVWFREEAERIEALEAGRRRAERQIAVIAGATGRLIARARGPLFKDKVVVILGMHRAGTSLCAKIVERLGVNLGGPFFAADFANRDGYREHKELVACHEALLRLMKTDWDAVRFAREDDPGFLTSDEVRPIRERMTCIVRDELATCGGTWGFKDPRTVHFIPLWWEILDDLGVAPVWLLSVREPGAVAASLARRDRLPRIMGEFLWLEHYLEALRRLGPQLGAVIHYERWFSPAGERQLARLAELVEAPAEAVESARGAIQAELRHHAPGRQPELDLAQQVHAWLLPENPDLPLLQRQAKILWKEIAKIGSAVG